MILQKIGNLIGWLLKINTCTSDTLRGRYIRLCVEVPLEHSVKSHIYIGSHKQPIVYESEYLLCKGCGKIGHTQQYCPNLSGQPVTQLEKEKQIPTETKHIKESPHLPKYKRVGTLVRNGLQCHFQGKRRVLRDDATRVHPTHPLIKVKL